MANSGIYQILNLRNGKSYIGSSIHPFVRKKEHFNLLIRNAHSNSKLQRAYNKEEDKSVFEFKILFYCEERLLLFYEQRCFDFIKPQYNCSLIAGKIEWTEEIRKKISGDNNVMKRPNVLLKHKESISSPEIRKRMGRSGIDNVMNRPEIREKHKNAVSNPEVRKKMGRAGDKNIMKNPKVKEKHLKNVKRGSNHHLSGRFGDLNFMSSPEVRKRQKQRSIECMSGDKNPIHRPEVKGKIKQTNSKTETKQKRALAISKISEQTAIEIYKMKKSVLDICKDTNLSYNTVYAIKTKRSWKYIHEKFKGQLKG